MTIQLANLMPDGSTQQPRLSGVTSEKERCRLKKPLKQHISAGSTNGQMAQAGGLPKLQVHILAKNHHTLERPGLNPKQCFSSSRFPFNSPIHPYVSRSVHSKVPYISPVYALLGCGNIWTWDTNSFLGAGGSRRGDASCHEELLAAELPGPKKTEAFTYSKNIGLRAFFSTRVWSFKSSRVWASGRLGFKRRIYAPQKVQVKGHPRCDKGLFSCGSFEA